MLKGFCKKKHILIADKKLVEYCLKVECIHLRFQIWRVERKIRRYARENDIALERRE